LPELYCQKYGGIVIGFTDLTFTVINHISLCDIMLIYQPIEELISVLYHCNILTTNNYHSSDESHMIKQAALP